MLVVLPNHSPMYPHAFLAVFDLGWQVQTKTLDALFQTATHCHIVRMAQYALFIHPTTPVQLVCSAAYHCPFIPRYSCTLQNLSLMFLADTQHGMPRAGQRCIFFSIP